MRAPRWAPEEVATLRRLYGTMPCAEVAKRLGFNVRRVQSKALAIGITRPPGRPVKPWTAEHGATLRELQTKGWSDADIGERIGHTRDRVSKERKRLGLPSQRKKQSERTREKARRALARTVEKHGIRSSGELRQVGWGRRAKALGWPADLRPRELQIMHALYHRGPMTRRELVAAMGLEWPGRVRALKSHGGSTYTADLMRRGLIENCGRIQSTPGAGRGKAEAVYAIPLRIHPTPSNDP